MWAEVHPCIPIALPPPGLCRDVRVTVMVCLSLPTRVTPAPLLASHVAAPLCEWVQAQDYKKPPYPNGPAEPVPRMTSWEYYGDEETSWAVLPRWNRTQAVWKTGEQTAAHNGRRSGIGKRGRAESSGEQKKRSHLPPRKIPGCAGGGSGGSTCRKQVPRHGTASLTGFFSVLDYGKERGEIYSQPAVQWLTTSLLLSG